MWLAKGIRIWKKVDCFKAPLGSLGLKKTFFCNFQFKNHHFPNISIEKSIGDLVTFYSKAIETHVASRKLDLVQRQHSWLNVTTPPRGINLFTGSPTPEYFESFESNAN